MDNGRAVCGSGSCRARNRAPRQDDRTINFAAPHDLRRGHVWPTSGSHGRRSLDVGRSGTPTPRPRSAPIPQVRGLQQFAVHRWRSGRTRRGGSTSLRHHWLWCRRPRFGCRRDCRRSSRRRHRRADSSRTANSVGSRGACHTRTAGSYVGTALRPCRCDSDARVQPLAMDNTALLRSCSCCPAAVWPLPRTTSTR